MVGDSCLAMKVGQAAMFNNVARIREAASKAKSLWRSAESCNSTMAHKHGVHHKDGNPGETCSWLERKLDGLGH